MGEIIDRESMLIYLNDLRVMESIIHQSNQKLDEINSELYARKRSLENEKKSLKSKWDFLKVRKRNEMPQRPFINKKANAVITNIKDEIKKIILYIVGCLVALLIASSFRLFIRAIIFIAVIPTFVVLVSCLIVTLVNFNKEHSRTNAKYEEEKAEYEIAMEEYRLEMAEYQADMVEYENELKKRTKNILSMENDYLEFSNKAIDTSIKIKDDMENTSELLSEAYSVNIIPLPFRNIRGIYYLYDYLSTSNQTFSEALMQCNLEAIKEKLDNVISLQAESVIKQAAANDLQREANFLQAKANAEQRKANAALYEQNLNILQATRSTAEAAESAANNTAVAAKYAQICAVNSDLSLKLQKEQLAYQWADFWMK